MMNNGSNTAFSFAIILVITTVILVLTINIIFLHPNEITCNKFQDHLEANSEVKIEKVEHQTQDEKPGCLVTYKDQTTKWFNIDQVSKTVR